jgi:arabinogalactan oligomer/maltooligosaccharide transport system permease protein
MVAKKFGNEFTTFAAGSVLIAIPISIGDEKKNGT